MKKINIRNGKLKFKYTTDIVENSDDILDLNQHLTLDYKLALENISFFQKKVGTLKKDCTILIGNIDKDKLEDYRLIFNYISDGGDLIYHYGGIVKKPSLKKKKRDALIRKTLKDFRFMWHGCIGIRTKHYFKEKKICELILNIRLENAKNI